MPVSTLKPVTFTCRAPEAKTAFVAGTFNDWIPDQHLLQRGPNGSWSTTLSVMPQHHEYKFIIDGKWCCETNCEHQYTGCPKCVPNAFGTMNRVIDVK